MVASVASMGCPANTASVHSPNIRGTVSACSNSIPRSLGAFQGYTVALWAIHLVSIFVLLRFVSTERVTTALFEHYPGKISCLSVCELRIPWRAGWHRPINFKLVLLLVENISTNLWQWKRREVVWQLLAKHWICASSDLDFVERFFVMSCFTLFGVCFVVLLCMYINLYRYDIYIYIYSPFYFYQ